MKQSHHYYIASPPQSVVQNFFSSANDQQRNFSGELKYLKLPYDANLIKVEDEEINLDSSNMATTTTTTGKLSLSSPSSILSSIYSLFFDRKSSSTSSTSSLYKGSQMDFDEQKEECRTYLCYIPNKLKNENNKPIPLIVLLHGTDETCFDTEWFFQDDGKHSWIDLADERGVILVFGQSMGCVRVVESEKSYMYGWQPGTSDMKYLDCLLHNVEINVKPIQIDRSRIYLCGYSNGGMFSSDVIMKFHNFSSTYQFAAVCNYMGGIEYTCEQDYEGMKPKSNIPILIITGTRDDNASRCDHAKKFFENAGLYVEFQLLGGVHHHVLSEKIKEIFDFLEKYK